jgi:hypothetical protein
VNRVSKNPLGIKVVFVQKNAERLISLKWHMPNMGHENARTAVKYSRLEAPIKSFVLMNV